MQSISLCLYLYVRAFQYGTSVKTERGSDTVLLMEQKCVCWGGGYTYKEMQMTLTS